jgi:DNA repair exonuclease SbcCD ATPase subunit
MFCFTQIFGESEVKARISLKFTNVAGNDVVVTRAYQVSARGGKSTFKTLEGNLKIQDDTMSHRCGDLNTLVPQLMGVSKSILDNVIFCHQVSFLGSIQSELSENCFFLFFLISVSVFFITLFENEGKNNCESYERYLHCLKC